MLAGAWLIAAPWLLSGGTWLSSWNSAAMGVLVVLLSIPLGKPRDHYGGFDRVVGFGPRAWIGR